MTHGRPVICSEYMARGEKNTVITVMPIAKRYNVGMINWGFADGKEQTKYPWDSWEKDILLNLCYGIIYCLKQTILLINKKRLILLKG